MEGNLVDLSPCNNEDINLKAKVQNRTIGHYSIGKTLGEGTFGKVKSGIHILTGEKVAIKILEKKKITDVSDVERVAREIHILKIMRHPHLIQLYEIIETSKQLYLITEYASGGELFDHIVANSKIKEEEACKYFQQIISGIEYIHKLKVVHRDLKPENLLLDESNNIKIADFGLSNTYQIDEKLKTACGSPCYAAPEMIAGNKYVGLLVDIWSAGVVLFAMLCGYLPFEDPVTTQLYKKILAGEYKIPKHVSEDAKDLLKHILTTDPTIRYKIDNIRQHKWYKINQAKEREGIIVGVNQIPIDKYILNQLDSFEINSEYARKCLEANKHNNATTTYYLLLKKNLREGIQSPADISSDNYKPESIGSKPKIKDVQIVKEPLIADYINLNLTFEKPHKEEKIKKESNEIKNLITVKDKLMSCTGGSSSKDYEIIKAINRQKRTQNSSLAKKPKQFLYKKTFFEMTDPIENLNKLLHKHNTSLMDGIKEKMSANTPKVNATNKEYLSEIRQTIFNLTQNPTSKTKNRCRSPYDISDRRGSNTKGIGIAGSNIKMYMNSTFIGNANVHSIFKRRNVFHQLQKRQLLGDKVNVHNKGNYEDFPQKPKISITMKNINKNISINKEIFFPTGNKEVKKYMKFLPNNKETKGRSSSNDNRKIGNQNY